MDFLEIRKKAKERAQARVAARAAEKGRAGAEPRATASRRPAEGGGARPPLRPEAAPPGSPAPDGVVTEQDLLEGALAARLQGLPAPGEPSPVPDADARFTTWRPGSGAPPAIAPEDDARVAPAPDDAAVAAAGAPPPRRERRHEVRRPPPQPAAPEPRPAAPADPLDEFFYRPDESAPALAQLAPAAALPEQEPAVLAREEYVTFLLGAEEYAVAIERVREIIKSPPITEVPRAPAHVLGVVTVRGEVVAVVDPRRRLGLPAAALAPGEGRVVIVDAGDGSCGLLVDRVASVVRLRPGSIEPCPQGIAGQRSEYLAGIGRAGERLFTVLDLAALLRRSPPRADGAARARSADAGA